MQRYESPSHLPSIHPPTSVILAVLGILVVSATALARLEEPTVGSAERSKIVKFVVLALKQGYVFPDKAEEMAGYIERQLSQGAYDGFDSLAGFAGKLTLDLQSISHDKHLRVRPLPPAEQDKKARPSPAERRRRATEAARRRNFGFHKLERLPGNVGLLDLRGFADAAMAGATAVRAMNFLSTADAVIVDLRYNGGGSPSMIQLISSYFFDRPVHLNSFYTRATDRMQEFWTHQEVEGPRMTGTPIYVLSSPRTFSAAEEFTYNLKHLGRATVIGETTGGGAHPVEDRRFPSLGVRLSLPFGRAVNPVTQTNWEGTGVEPHVSVPARRALLVAHRLALQDLLHKQDDRELQQELWWHLEHAEAALDPVELEPSALEAFVGLYGQRRIRLLGGVLWFQRPNDVERRISPLSPTTFRVEEHPTMRLHFNGEAGRPAQELVRTYVDGRRQAWPRSLD